MPKLTKEKTKQKISKKLKKINDQDFSPKIKRKAKQSDL